MLSLLSIALVSSALSGCAPPTERRTPVVVESAPYLQKGAAGDEELTALLHRGDVLEVVQATGRRLAWKGMIEAQEATRDDELVEVRRAADEPPGFMFRKDLGEAVEVPSASWLCTRSGGGAACKGRLRRATLSHTVLGYAPCPDARCSVVVYADGGPRSGHLATYAIDRLDAAQLAVIEGRPIVLAATRWLRAPGWAGESLVALRLDEPIRRALEVVIDEQDHRNSPFTDRAGHVSIEGDALVFRGKKQIIAPSIAAIMYATPLVETYRLAK